MEREEEREEMCLGRGCGVDREMNMRQITDRQADKHRDRERQTEERQRERQAETVSERDRGERVRNRG